MIQLFDSVMLLECDEVLPVMRIGRVTQKDGKPVYRDVIWFRSKFNVQPTSGKDLLLVPEANRFREQLTVWQPAHAQVPVLDMNCRILRADKVYQVLQAKPWEGSYVEAMVMRIDVQGEQETLALYQQQVC